MKLRTILFYLFIVNISCLNQASFVFGDETQDASSDLSESFRVRAKLGTNVTFDPVLSGTTSVGLDVTHFFTEKCGLTAGIDRVFYSGGMKSTFFGLTPNFAMKYESWHFYWGVFTGMKIFNPGSYPLKSEDQRDYSYFALGPVGGVDYDIFKSLFVHSSIRYLRSLGSDLGSGYDVLIMGGIGLKF